MHSTSISKGIRRLVGAATCASMVYVAAPSYAQDGAQAETTKDGYGYKFLDDPMQGLGGSPNGAVIKTRPGPIRQTLIRPRTNFVPELLKTVENL